MVCCWSDPILLLTWLIGYAVEGSGEASRPEEFVTDLIDEAMHLDDEAPAQRDSLTSSLRYGHTASDFSSL
mgnify:CR=1 FL=1